MHSVTTPFSVLHNRTDLYFLISRQFEENGLRNNSSECFIADTVSEANYDTGSSFPLWGLNDVLMDQLFI